MTLVCILSFLFDGIFSLLFNNNSMFLTLFSLMCLIVIYPYLKKSNYIFYIAAIIGIFFDIVYTQTLFLNTIIFFLLSFLIYFYYKYLPYNIVNTLILSLIMIVLYRLITYIFFIIFNDNMFNIHALLKSIYNSIISNFIYIILMNSFCKIILKKKVIINKIQ